MPESLRTLIDGNDGKLWSTNMLKMMMIYDKRKPGMHFVLLNFETGPLHFDPVTWP